MSGYGAHTGLHWTAGRNEPAPPLCTCLIAYSNVTLMRRLFIGAAARLTDRRGRYLPSDPPDQPWFHVRQSDQEMIWFEYTRAQTALRVVTLPEEYYCPTLPIETDDDNPSAKAIWSTDYRMAQELRVPRWEVPGLPVPLAARTSLPRR